MTFPGEDSVARNLRVRDRLLDELKLAPGEERTVEWNVRQAIAHIMTPKSTGKVPGILAQSTPREPTKVSECGPQFTVGQTQSKLVGLRGIDYRENFAPSILFPSHQRS